MDSLNVKVESVTATGRSSKTDKSIYRAKN